MHKYTQTSTHAYMHTCTHTYIHVYSYVYNMYIYMKCVCWLSSPRSAPEDCRSPEGCPDRCDMHVRRASCSCSSTSLSIRLYKCQGGICSCIACVYEPL